MTKFWTQGRKNQILERKKKSRPFLGICIGMQLMGEVSYERGENEGLKLLEANVVEIPNKQGKIRIPHIGWNDIKIENKNYNDSFSSLDRNDFYFVHSYHMKCKNKNEILATVNYGSELVAAICKDNIIGVQFHPEKSQISGKKFLQEFLEWMP